MSSANNVYTAIEVGRWLDSLQVRDHDTGRRVSLPRHRRALIVQVTARVAWKVSCVSPGAYVVETLA